LSRQVRYDSGAMTKRTLLPILALTILLGVVACGGGDGSGPASAPDVDRVADAVTARDVAALLDLVAYQQLACTAQADDAAGPPLCRAGEADGTVVEAVPIVAQCESSYLRPGDVENALDHLVDPRPEVYAAFEVPETWASGEYAVVLSSSEQGRPVATELVIEGGKIVVLDFGCGESPEERIAGIDEDTFVIEPPAPSVTPEG